MLRIDSQPAHWLASGSLWTVTFETPTVMSCGFRARKAIRCRQCGFALPKARNWSLSMNGRQSRSRELASRSSYGSSAAKARYVPPTRRLPEGRLREVRGCNGPCHSGPGTPFPIGVCGPPDDALAKGNHVHVDCRFHHRGQEQCRRCRQHRRSARPSNTKISCEGRHRGDRTSSAASCCSTAVAPAAVPFTGSNVAGGERDGGGWTQARRATHTGSTFPAIDVARMPGHLTSSLYRQCPAARSTAATGRDVSVKRDHRHRWSADARSTQGLQGVRWRRHPQPRPRVSPTSR